MTEETTSVEIPLSSPEDVKGLPPEASALDDSGLDSKGASADDSGMESKGASADDSGLDSKGASSRGQSEESSCSSASSSRVGSRQSDIEKPASKKKDVSAPLDEDLWGEGQEWILIFDRLLKHPRGVRSKGCWCDLCEAAGDTPPNRLPGCHSKSTCGLHSPASVRRRRGTASSSRRESDCEEDSCWLYGKITIVESDFKG